MYTSISYPQPNWIATPIEAAVSATTGSWILIPMEWVPGSTTKIPFNRYFNGDVHEVTTGWIDPTAAFQLESLLGYLYANSSGGATVPFYGCKSGLEDYFVSLDVGCE